MDATVGLALASIVAVLRVIRHHKLDPRLVSQMNDGWRGGTLAVIDHLTILFFGGVLYQAVMYVARLFAEV